MIEEKIEELDLDKIDVEQLEDLTVDMLSKAHEKYETTREELIFIEVGEEIKTVKLGFYEKFSPSSIKDCISEFIKNMDLANKVTRKKIEGLTEPYFMYLLIKYFTEMGKEMPSTLKEQLASMNHMMDIGVFFQIISHFDDDELEKTREALADAVVKIEEGQSIIDEVKKLAEGKIENKELLE